MKLLSVMTKRDDLPAMRLPLAVLMTAATILMSVVSGRLAEDFVGAVAALPFMALSVCLYALIILLWRRVASLLVAPLVFSVLLFARVPLFTASAISVSLLFVSYVFAVSLIAGESRFRRLTSLSMSISLCLGLIVISYAGLHADSYDTFVSLCMERLSYVIGTVCKMPPSLTYIRKTARGIIVLSPAYLAAVSSALAWFTELLAKSMFRLLGCRDLFIRVTHRITLPLPYALIYGTAFLLLTATIPDSSPFTYALLSSVVISMILPCAAVGWSIILRKLRARMYYASRKRVLTNIIMLTAIATLGLSNAVMLLSVAGIFFVTADFFRKRKKSRKNSHREAE